MKTILLLSLSLALLLLTKGSAKARDVQTHFPDVVSSNHVTVELIPDGKAPEWMAVVVQSNDPMDAWRVNQKDAMAKWRSELATNHNARPSKMPPPPFNHQFDVAQWLPFKTNMIVDLGSGAGKRTLMFGFRYKGEVHCNSWSGSGVMVQTSPPFVVFTNPKEGITSRPMIQLQGYVSSDLDGGLRYQMFNESGVVTANGEGLVNDRHYDPIVGEFTTNYFTCYDIDLNPGTNTIVLRGTDRAGFSFTTNFICVFTTVGDTTPPLFKLDWPQDGMSISGSEFSLIGLCDDPTAIVTAFICNDEGKATKLNGIVEREGCLWVEYMPLAEGKNFITVVTTDAAQNSSVTNLMVTKSNFTLYMDQVSDPQMLWRPKITITGYCSLTNRTVFVNGVKANMNPDGHWTATNVPVITPHQSGATHFEIKTDDDDCPPPTNSWLPMICSQPVENNALSAGISLMAISTNEYNHYPIYLGFTNGSGRSIPNTWMLPKADARYSLRLFDQTNKEVVKQEWMEKSGQTLATNLNTHHLGKNELDNIAGIISFSTNATARIASLNLDQHFQLPPPGDYRLEVVARMFKIAADGQLIPFEFPPISTAIKIIDQPSEMVFYLNDLQRQGKLVWGAERYGLRIGVAHGMKWTRINDANQIEIFLQNTGTNDYRNRNLQFPTPNEQFDVTLYDAGGKQVPKTALGKQHGQALSLEGQDPRKTTGVMDEIFGNIVRSGRRLRPVFVSAKDATECGRFNLNDYFEIKTPGKYRLTYQQRFYRWNTNSILTGIIMPIVNVPLDISYIPSQ